MSQQTAQIPHEQKVLIVVMGFLDKALNSGHLTFVDNATGKPVAGRLMTPASQDIFLDLMRERFLPTDQEIEWAMAALQREGYI